MGFGGSPHFPYSALITGIQRVNVNCTAENKYGTYSMSQELASRLEKKDPEGPAKKSLSNRFFLLIVISNPTEPWRFSCIGDSFKALDRYRKGERTFLRGGLFVSLIQMITSFVASNLGNGGDFQRGKLKRPSQLVVDATDSNSGVLCLFLD